MNTDRGTPLSLCADDELDLQIGTEIVRHVVGSTVPKIEPLRQSLRLVGKFLARIRSRDNPTMSPHAFVLRHFGWVIAEGEYPFTRSSSGSQPRQSRPKSGPSWD